MLLREVLAAASGNELSVGLAMASWLGCAAAGSVLAGRLGTAAAARSLWLSALATALLPSACLAAARWTPVALGMRAGEVGSLEAQLLAQALALGPIAAVGGAQLALAIRARAIEPTRAYLAEALGWLMGGAASTWALSALAPFYSLALVAAAALSAALLLSPRLWFAAAALALPAALHLGTAALERATLALRWPGQQVKLSVYTAAGHHALVGNAGQLAWYEDGHLAFVLDDRQRAEELVHVALLHVEQPRRVLVAGAVAGLLPRALEHPIEEVVVVVPRAMPLDLLARAVGGELGAALSNGRVRVARDDLRRLLGDESEKPWDAVVLDVAPPSTLLSNRYFTREFFELARAKLRPGGVLAFPLPAADGYLDRALVERNGSVFKALESSFPFAAVAPMASHFALGLSTQPLDAARLGSRLAERRIPTQFVETAYIEAFLDPARQAELVSAYRGALGTNADAHPVACMHELALWRRAERGFIGGTLESVAGQRPWTLGSALLGTLAAGSLLLSLPRRRSVRSAWPVLGVVSTGFATMSLGILLLLAVQIAAGSLHHLLGALLAAHMAGNAAGAWLGARRNAAPWLAPGVALLVTSGVAGVFLAANALPLGVLLAAAALLNAAAGASAGMAFPASLGRGVPASIAYGADLVGGMLAAVATSALIIPAHGLGAALAMTAAVLGLGLLASLSVRGPAHAKR